MAEFYLEPNAYTYAATPTWGTAQEGDGRNGAGFVAGAITLSGGAITNIAITTAGTGYSVNTKVYIGGTGSGAVVTVASVNSTGGITAFTISNGGTGYTGTPTVTLVPGNAVPATVSIDMTGWTFSTSSTVSVMGGTAITCTASATTSAESVTPNAQYSATLTTMIDNLVTAINFHGANTVNHPSESVAHKIRNVVFARRTGNSLELMTRAGSARYNTLTAVTFANVTGSSSQTWSGGQSGVWGWLTNYSTTIWPSALARRTYGAFHTAAQAAPLVAATLAVSDVINIRANNVTLSHNQADANSAIIVSTSATFLVDDGTVWVGDTGTLTHQVTYTNVAQGISVGAANVVFAARTLGRWRFVVEAPSASITAATLFQQNAASLRMMCVNLDIEVPAGTNVGGLQLGAAASNSSSRYVGCRYTNYRNTFYEPVGTMANYASQSLVMEGCEFNWPNFSGTPTRIINAASINNGGTKVALINCKAYTVNTGLTPFALNTVGFSAQIGSIAVAKNCYGFNIPVSLYGLSGASTQISDPELQSGAFLQNIGPKREFRIENNTGALEWLDGQGFPTLDALLPDGTAWAYRYVWPFTSGNAIRATQPVEILCLTKTLTNALGTGVRTVALELEVDDAYDHLLTFGHVGIEVTYVANSDSVPRTERTRGMTLPGQATIPPSSKTWTHTAGGYNGTHVPRKLELTTSLAVKPNTEIECRFMVFKEPATSQSLFINPELTIT